jgi:tetratricopeptide (TPR) repeat protein
LLLPAGSDLLERLVAASETDTAGSDSAAGGRPSGRQGVMSSDTRGLLDYRLGAFARVGQRRSLMPIQPRLAAITLIRAMAMWRSKDYWGAMVEYTKGYALVQAGARQGRVTLAVRSELFPGTRDPDYLQAAWYDWAVAGLLLREWDEMLGATEPSALRGPEGTPSLEQVALVRALGEWHALRGGWSDAVRCSQYCLQRNQGDSVDHVPMDYLNAALGCRQLGDENGYSRVRDEMAERLNEPDDRTAERILVVGLLRSLDDPTVARLKPLAARLERAVAGGDETPSLPPLLGLLHYRRGDYGKAIEWTHRGVSKFANVAQPHALARVILAMSLHQLGDLPAAQQELEHAKHLVETGFDLEFDMWWWRYWVLVRLLLQEAERLMPQAQSPQPVAPPP